MDKVPVIILSGFLGSGKTTLLTRILEYYSKGRLRPAVIMNEVGDVNLDGQLVNEMIPMREMLSGCICCTIRGDLGMEIRNLILETSPDLILIEATGVANPLEIFEAVTEAALLVPIDIRTMISIVDAGHFLEWRRKGTGKTYHLIEDQIRCASLLLLNKADLVSTAELNESKRLMAEINPHTSIYPTVYCEISEETLNQVLLEGEKPSFEDIQRKEPFRHSEHQHDTDGQRELHGHHEHGHEHHEHDEHCEHHGDHSHHHHSYDHVMVYTHYFDGPLDSTRFEQMISELPGNIYRAKGIFTEADSSERMMFQYAYQQLDILPIKPQGSVQDVAVFLGEQFSKQELKRKLEAAL
ncbi:CobW family GTP-binding protein [Paenibacillus senegalensis]|uniref:CobW family GTP-binding protein n=1 Tax=Paenibacillus senegalensis TaxID=1465766 RepID=UPI00028954FE|nr:GTP-binding protein [Paenibacillus senegalensis]